MLNVKNELNLLAQRIKNQVLVNLHGNDGVNPKTGRNTLIGSNLEKSIDAYATEDAVVFQIADYYTYIVGGRKKGWGTPPPTGFVQGVTDWVRRKNIRFNGKTENQTVFLILKSIVEKGISARPFIGNGFINDNPSYVLPFLDDFFDTWADDLFDKLTNDIDNYFK